MRQCVEKRRLYFETLEHRNLLAGGIDLSFGIAGVSTGNRGSFLEDVVELADGKLLAAGVIGVRDAIVQRYLPDGSPDTSFANNGSLNLGFWRGGNHRL